MGASLIYIIWFANTHTNCGINLLTFLGITLRGCIKENRLEDLRQSCFYRSNNKAMERMINLRLFTAY